jgi:hypothetical protein
MRLTETLLDGEAEALIGRTWHSPWMGIRWRCGSVTTVFTAPRRVRPAHLDLPPIADRPIL